VRAHLNRIVTVVRFTVIAIVETRSKGEVSSVDIELRYFGLDLVAGVFLGLRTCILHSLYRSRCVGNRTMSFMGKPVGI
jgi:hypothetical protein